MSVYNIDKDTHKINIIINKYLRTKYISLVEICVVKHLCMLTRDEAGYISII